MVRCALAVLVAGCSFRHGVTGDAAPVMADVADAPIDARIDAPLDGEVPCISRWQAGTIRFAAPVPISEIDTAGYERDPYVSADELTIYFSTDRNSAPGGGDVYVAKRTRTDQPFGTPVVWAPASTPGFDSKMSITPDGLLFVVASNQSGTKGLADIWQAARSSTSNNFGALDESHEGGIDDTADQLDPELSPDGTHLYFASSFAAQKIVLATRTDTSKNFSAPQVITEIDNPANQADPAITADELVIVFSSGRTGSGLAGGNLWYAARAQATDPFGTPHPVPDVNSNSNDGDAHLAADGCRLYFASDRGGDWDIYVAAAM